MEEILQHLGLLKHVETPINKDKSQDEPSTGARQSGVGLKVDQTSKSVALRLA